MKRIWNKGWRPILVLILVFILWEAAVRILHTPEWLLPAPSQIVMECYHVFPTFWPDVLSTVRLAFLGMILGNGIGLLIALLLHLTPKVREAFYPLLIISQNIPTIVLAPLLVIWFGFGWVPKLFIIALVCFFPVAVSALDGFRQVPREYMHYMEMAGANTKQIFFKLELPSSLPSVFSGLKLSATYSVMGAVISEWLGAEKGIGVFMTFASSSFHTAQVFVAIFFIIALSLVFVAVIHILEKWLIRGQSRVGEAS